MTWERCAYHVRQLAREHGITIEEKGGYAGRAYDRDRRIKITPVRGAVSYAMALHELGHLIADGASGRKNQRLVKEMRAWQWARKHAAIWSDRMDATMQTSLRSYLHRARRHHWPIPEDIYQLVED
jgi:hypothetical protein